MLKTGTFWSGIVKLPWRWFSPKRKTDLAVLNRGFLTSSLQYNTVWWTTWPSQSSTNWGQVSVLSLRVWFCSGEEGGAWANGESVDRWLVVAGPTVQGKKTREKGENWEVSGSRTPTIRPQCRASECSSLFVLMLICWKWLSFCNLLVQSLLLKDFNFIFFWSYGFHSLGSIAEELFYKRTT